MYYWYSLQETPEDSWDNGTYNRDYALRQLVKNPRYNLIAVINEETNYCEEVILKENVYIM